MSAIPILEIVGNSDGGGTRFVAAIMGRLNPSRFQLTLVAPRAEWLGEACAHAGALYRPLPLMSSRTSDALRRDLRATLSETKPAIVHVHGTRAAWLVSRSLPTGANTPAFIYSEHLFSMDARRGPLKLPWYLIERAICRRADFVTTGCNANANRAIRAGWVTPNRLALRHYGIDQSAIRTQAAVRLTLAELGLPADALVVGAVGRLVPQKGFTYLLRAMKLVLTRFPHAHCLVVGDGALRAALEAQSRALGIEGHVWFLGAQAHPWAALARCDVIALPSLFEGLWLALIEALTLGLPVVATTTGGAKELLVSGQNGLLVPTRDASALAGALERVLRDPALRLAFRAAGPPAVAAYDLPPVVAQMAAMYERAANRLGRETAGKPPHDGESPHDHPSP
jgi:glycosyltransferase involved in cell wall biosynthesis